MLELKLKVINKKGDTLQVSDWGSRVSVVHTCEYQEGDFIVLESNKQNVFVMVSFEDSMGESLIYLKNPSVSFYIPFGEGRICYSPKSFTGEKHLITARMATEEEIGRYRNLALNPYDQHGDIGYYPHSTANVETRGESVFASRNAVDGIFENSSHGSYPYQSWGINRRPDAEIKIDFGRTVVVDKAALTLRADFPHDSYWTQVTLAFSDGSTLTPSLKKTACPQEITFEKKEIEWVVMKDMKKADDESPFPALTQIEIFGTEK